MKLIKNQLLKFILSEEETVIERILWIDERYEKCITIDIDIKKKESKPQLQELSEVHQLMEDGYLEVVTNDPHRVYFLDEDLSESEKKIRDSRWETIKELVVLEPDIYLESPNKMIGRVFEDKKVSKRAIYHNLRLYWKKGCNKNTLIPNFRDCGGRGIKKNLGYKKTGRKKKYNSKNSGMNVTPEVEYFFGLGIKKYKESNKVTIKDIYEFITGEYFVDYYRYEKNRKIPILKELRPSERQFRYWYQKNSGLTSEERNKNKKGKRQHMLNHRPLLGRSDSYTRAPGLKFQVDSTTANVYLVSELNPDLVIQRPTIYFFIDVYSRMVTGIYIDIVNESWEALKMALINTAMNKVKYCASYGIDIEEKDWPSHYLPESILSDRGAEYTGYKPQVLVNAFGIKLERTPSYRAEFKGIVEKKFDTMDHKLRTQIPGTVTKESGKRGEANPRLGARLTLREFTAAVIREVLHYNNDHWLANYNPDKEMIEDKVPLIPAEIWKWGIKNRSGQLKYYSEDEVKLSLLSKKTGRVTKFGISLTKDIYYSSEKLEKDGWFQDAALKGSWETDIFYHPNNLKQVYVKNEQGAYEACTLLYKSMAYEDVHIEDYKAVSEHREEMKKTHQQNSELQSKALFNEDIKAIVSEAKERHKEHTKRPNKSNKPKNIDENTRRERELTADIRDASPSNLPRKKEEAERLPKQSKKKNEQEPDYNSEHLKMLWEMQEEALTNE